MSCPRSLVDVGCRVNLVEAIDKPLLVDSDGVAQWLAFGEHLALISERGAEIVPELSNPLDCVSIALRVWAGCTMAAKTIAFETRSGVNTAAARAAVFDSIDIWADADVLFRAGVEAAPPFRTNRGQCPRSRFSPRI